MLPIVIVTSHGTPFIPLPYPLHSHSHLTHSFGYSDVPYYIILNSTPFPLLLASTLRFMPWDMGLCFVFFFLCSLLARILSFSPRTDAVETIVRKILFYTSTSIFFSSLKGGSWASGNVHHFSLAGSFPACMSC